MGIWDKIKGEFIDIIEWLDASGDVMVHRFERHNNEIKNGAKLTVRESQVAVLINEGQLADVFKPGMYTLTTENMPILSTLKGWKYGFSSPFKVEVYFVNTKQFTDLKWGTPNPIMLRDPEFGPIRIRAFGNYSMRVIDAAKFIREIVGTDGEFTTDKVTDQLKSIVITRFTDALGECKIPILDLAANYDEMSKLIGDKLKPEFQEYGIDMTKLLVSNISLPPNVEEALDKRSSMGIIGDMSKFTQFQTANAIGDMAKNTGEGGGMMAGGMGMGMGFAMAGQMGNAMNPQNQQQQQQQGAAMPPPVVAFHVVVNGQQAGPFDLGTLQQQIASGQLTPQTMVWKAGLANWIPASQAPELAGLFPQTPPPIAPPPPPVG